jgi:hypothetical protein
LKSTSQTDQRALAKRKEAQTAPALAKGRKKRQTVPPEDEDDPIDALTQDTTMMSIKGTL